MDGPARWRILRLHVEDGIPLSALARETGISLRSLERWHARYRADGYAGLETGQRSDAGAHHLPGELVRLIEGLALSKPRPAIATIHRKATEICAQERWPVPSYGVVRAIVADMDVVIADTQAAIDGLDEVDLTSQDVAIAIKAGLDKDRWFLVSHIAA